MDIGTAILLLNDHLELALNKSKPGEETISMKFPKSSQAGELLEIYDGKKIDFSLRYKPVDIQYTMTLEKQNRDYNLDIVMNREYTLNNLIKNSPPIIEPKYTFSNSRLVNAIISIILNLIAAFIWTLVIHYFHKRRESWSKSAEMEETSQEHKQE